ncbi:hypothetical protein AGMMS50293_29490 [Spirochaetia bacterium]|nr:hypothetical protein AGMMS50293_29490 [Spirochaetia bacterium]
MKKAVVILIAAVLAISGCDFFMGPDTPVGKGNLTITLGDRASRAALSSEITNTFSYTFTFTGPGDQTFTRELEPGVPSLNETVALGQWSIKAEAYNSAGILAGTGSVNYTVIAGVNTVLVPMTLSDGYNADNEITGFSFATPAAVGTINGTAISVTVPYGTDVTNLTPTVIHNGASVSPASGETQDFTGPVTYTVTAALGSTQEYTVTVTVAPSFTSIADVTTYLNSTSGGGSAGAPIPLPVSLELSSANWTALLTAINTANKYIALDLSTCTASGESSGGGLNSDWTFNPDYNITTGKGKIVGITLPDAAMTITAGTISNGAFKNFSALTTVNGAGVLTIGAAAFQGCTSLTSVSLPVVTTIGYGVFGNCTSLTSVSLPTVISIVESAFTGCTNLTSVSLSAALTSISSTAFSHCANLTTFVIAPENTVYSVSLDGKMLLSKDGFTLLAYPSATGAITLSGSGITAVGNFAFNGCTSLTSVDLPDVITIGYSVFGSCNSLNSVNLPNVTSIDSSAFNGCTSLTSVNLPEVISIGSNAFQNCTSLTSVSLPAALTSISSIAFINCANLTTFDIAPENTAYKASDNGKMLLSKDGFTLIAYPSATGAVTLSGITAVGNSAFQYCTSLTSVDLPDVTSIGYSAFYYCSSLTSVDLPDVTSIGYSAFQGCSSLSTLTLGTTPPTLGGTGTNIYPFYQAASTFTIRRPNASAALYETWYDTTYAAVFSGINITFADSE